jgi:heptose-I-phosphate ethanolaminephosphotransferase
MVKKIENNTLLMTLLFIGLVLVYFLLGYLTYDRAGKIALASSATIALLSALLRRYPNNILKIVAAGVIFILFANLYFHTFIHDVFKVDQEDVLVVKALFETDTKESLEFLQQYQYFIIKHIFLFVVSYSLYLYLFFQKHLTKKVSISMKILLAWVLFFIAAHAIKSMRRGNPFVYFPHYYTKWKGELQELENLNKLLKKNIKNSTLKDITFEGDKNNTLVWVIGEASTKYNWSLYGYERNTTPLMQKRVQKGELLQFNNIKAAGPYTTVAFKRMFTQATLQQKELWKKTPSLLQIAKQAGYHIYWITNQTTDSYSSIIHLFAKQADEFYLTNRGKARGESDYDESVIPHYKKALSDPYKKKFIIVHFIESHAKYEFRYPKEFAKYTTTFDDKVAKELETKRIAKWAIFFRNTYDNSIYYNDYVKNRLLDILQHSKEANNSTWLYHPDHGEDVCHYDNFSGHNPKVKEQWDIPMLLWPKSKFLYVDNNRSFRLDQINNTILNLLKIKTKFYDKNKDILAR